MKRNNFGQFYKFVEELQPSICALWNHFNNDPEPQKGDYYLYSDYDGKYIYKAFIMIYDKVIFDDKFENGVAFYYIFYKDKTNEEFKLHSINSVYDITKLSENDKKDLYSFWKHCRRMNISD